MQDLLRPFSFLTIRHPSRLPIWVNWLLPMFATLVALAALGALGRTVNIYGGLGLIDRALNFIQTLTGFYIAALAAVSSFNSPHLDHQMPNPAPTMCIRYNGVMQNITATRRRFLTSMFAYLTALSFLFSITCIAVITLAPALKHVWPNATPVLHWAGLSAFLFAIFQMTCVTFWGLFYLGERMLTPD